MPIFGRATHTVTPPTTPGGAPTVTPIPAATPTESTTLYDYTYFWYTVRNIVVGGMLLLAGWWLVSTWTTGSGTVAYYSACERGTLCNAAERARIAKDTGAHIDTDGNIKYADKVVGGTHEPPRTVVNRPAPAPVAVAPPPRAHVPGTHYAKPDGPGRCHFNPNGPMAGKLGYVWPDGRCHVMPPGGTPVRY